MFIAHLSNPRRCFRLSILFIGITLIVILMMVYMGLMRENTSDPTINESQLDKLVKFEENVNKNNNNKLDDGILKKDKPNEMAVEFVTLPSDNKKSKHKIKETENKYNINDDDDDDGGYDSGPKEHLEISKSEINEMLRELDMAIKEEEAQKKLSTTTTTETTTTTNTTPEPTTTTAEPTTTTPEPTTTTPAPTTTEAQIPTTTTTPAPKLCKQCYEKHFTPNKTIEYLENILTAKEQPSPIGQNIFFHETSCTMDGIVRLKSRQACSVESAAKTNPKMNVFVLFASPVGFEKDIPKSPIIEGLLKYPNIHFRNVDVWTYIQDTVPETIDFINGEEIFKSQFMIVHMADFLRLISLYRYGGTIFDLDFIVKKDLSTLPPNYLCEEVTNVINNGIMNFGFDGVGHNMGAECLREFSKTYKGNEWGFNGPILITRMIQRLCEIQRVTLCPWFRVFNSEAFCPVSYWKLELLFNSTHTKEALDLTKDSFAIHCWNAMSSSKTVLVGSNVGYGKFAEEYCPNVYSSCGEYF